MAKQIRGMIGRKTSKVVVVCILIVVIVSGIIMSCFLVGKNRNKKRTDNISSYDDFNALDYIEIGDYKNLVVNIGVSEADIKSEVDSLIQDNVTYKKKFGKVEDGDTVYADFAGYIDGKKMDVTCGSDYIEIGSGDWLEGFEDSIRGSVTGKNIEFFCDVPEGTYDDKEIDGHKVKFKVKVNYICGKKITPKYNNEFVKKISEGKYKNVSQYNAYIKDKLLEENEKDKGDYAWTDVLENCKVIKYPEEMLADAEKETLQGYYDMAEIYGYTVEEVLKEYGYDSLDEFKKTDLKIFAEDTVKEKLAARAIVMNEKINYSDKEYDDILEEEYGYNSEKYASKEEFEKKNKQYVKDMVTLSVVKKWLAVNLKFDKEKS